MAFTNQTTHYGLPQWIGSDKPTYLVDQNNAYQTIDSEIYNANVAAGDAVTTANGAATTAASAAASAATAIETANSATTTAQTADTKADNATTIAQAAQTAAGAAQTAAEAAQTAAAGNSITNLANAYDPTLTYNVGDLVTQNGKLYQCITQISSPEAFDINKWDDKTTSEVYAPKAVATSTNYNYLKTDFETLTSTDGDIDTLDISFKKIVDTVIITTMNLRMSNLTADVRPTIIFSHPDFTTFPAIEQAIPIGTRGTTGSAVPTDGGTLTHQANNGTMTISFYNFISTAPAGYSIHVF